VVTHVHEPRLLRGPDNIHPTHVHEPRLFENRFASPQPFLLDASGLEWRLVVKADIYERRPPPTTIGRQERLPL
jgi:hypothetical protein